MLEAAAAQACTNLSDFVRRKALEAPRSSCWFTLSLRFRQKIGTVRGVGAGAGQNGSGVA
ncbi:MAG: hypothetical protein WDN04_05080 [Rhodospirillales bacterium]